MNNMQCQNKNHHSKEVITVCLDKNCKEQRLCCLLCQAEPHISHLKQSVEVNQLTKFIEQEKQKENKYPDCCTQGQKQQIQGLEKLLTLIDYLQKIIKENIEKIKQQNLTDYLKKVGNNQQGTEYWSQLLEGILQYIEVDNCLIKLTKSKEGELNNTEEREIKFITQFEEGLSSMINQLDQSQIEIKQIQFKVRKLCFGNRKHPHIAVIDDCTIKKTTETSFAMAYANEGFDPKNQSYAFAFKIQGKQNDLWIGVGNDEGNNASFLFNNWYKIGHGQYMNTYSGRTYHHTDEKLNAKESKGIVFKIGETVQIKYDHITKELEFRNNSAKTFCRMPITDMTKKLYPCVMLYHSEQQIQLVEY